MTVPTPNFHFVNKDLKHVYRQLYLLILVFKAVSLLMKYATNVTAYARIANKPSETVR